MLNLRLHRINYPEHGSDYQTAHYWMREQPDLYGDDIGFNTFGEFTHPPLDRIEFALRDDDNLIAFAYFVRRAPKICEFGLITPARPRVRSILALLEELQRQYFETLGFVALYTQYPDSTKYDRSRRLCRMFGWVERKPDYFEYTILDFIEATYGSKETDS